MSSIGMLAEHEEIISSISSYAVVVYPSIVASDFPGSDATVASVLPSPLDRGYY